MAPSDGSTPAARSDVCACRARSCSLNRTVRAEVLLDRQLLLIIHGDHVIRAVPISTGAGGGTPRVRTRVYSKSPNSWSKPYEAWLPWASYFNGGIAFHGYPDVPVYPASHGCVRVPVEVRARGLPTASGRRAR